MTDHANTYTRYHAGPDIDDSPLTVTLPDSRTLAFVDYDYTRGHAGSRMDPPTPAEVTVNDAWWVTSDGTEMDLTVAELEAIHDGPAYDAILDAVEEIESERYWAAMADSSYAAIDGDEVDDV